MSTLSEIRAALPQLTPDELRAVDAALRQQFRQRKFDAAEKARSEEFQALVKPMHEAL